ncbi:MAG TPA: ATP-binding protein [Thermoplasmata archaeon]|nr:ATP-binding protein [Thermoplasmata archaeon]
MSTDGPPPRAWLSWSSGKDAAFALSEVRRTREVDVVALLSVVSEAFGRVSMHGVREELLQAQARAAGLPLVTVRLPYPCPNEVYEEAMRGAMERARRDGVQAMVFGDLFLEEVRRYREERLAPLGVRAVFPLWGRPTDALARSMIEAGVHARICCLDPKRLPRSFAGRRLDATLLDELPPDVDPCGERGEFHTFVSEAPALRSPVPVRVGETVERDGFVFTDLIPA